MKHTCILSATIVVACCALAGCGGDNSGGTVAVEPADRRPVETPTPPPDQSMQLGDVPAGGGKAR